MYLKLMNSCLFGLKFISSLFTYIFIEIWAVDLFPGSDTLMVQFQVLI